MFLYILKAIALMFFCYGIYSFIMFIFDIIDSRRYRHCAYIDSDKVSDLEDAVYAVLLKNPNTEIYIVYHGTTDDTTKKLISMLTKRYDIVYSVEDM